MANDIEKQITETVQPITKSEDVVQDIIPPSVSTTADTLTDVAEVKDVAESIMPQDPNPAPVTTTENVVSDEELIAEAMTDEWTKPVEGDGYEVAGLYGDMAQSMKDIRMKDVTAETVIDIGGTEKIVMKGNKIYAAQASDAEVDLLNAALFGTYDPITKQYYRDATTTAERKIIKKMEKYVPKTDENGLIDIRTQEDLSRYLYEVKMAYKKDLANLKSVDGDELSFDEVLKRAMKLNNTAIVKKIFKLEKGEALGKPEEVVLANVINLNSLFRLRDTAKYIQEGKLIPGAKTIEESNAIFAQSLIMHKALNAKVAGNNSSIARNLSFIQSIGKWFEVNPYTGKGGIEALENIDPTDGVILRGKSISEALPGLTETKDFQVLATRFLELDNAARQNNFLNKMEDLNFLQKGWRYTGQGLDYITESHSASILFDPNIMLLNVIGNTATIANRPFEVAYSTAYGKMREKFWGVLGKETEPAYSLNRPLAEMTGMAHSLWEAMRVFGYSMWNEKNIDDALKFDNRKFKATGVEPGTLVGDMFQAFGIKNAKETTLGRALDFHGKMIRVPLRINMSVDEFFKTINNRAYLYGETITYRDKLLSEGLGQQEIDSKMIEFLENIPPDVSARADEFQKTQTYTRKVKFGPFNSSRVTRHPMFKLLVSLFYNTPVNVLDYTTRRTPLFVANPNFYKDILAGGVRSDLALGQVTHGTVTLGLLGMIGGGMLDKGTHITGPAPTNPREKALWEERGYLANHLYKQNPDTGKWEGVSYAGAEPWSDYFALANHFKEIIQNSLDGEVNMEAAVNYMQEIAVLLTSYMSDSYPGLQNAAYIFDLLKNPYDQSWSTRIGEYLGAKAGDTVFGAGTQIVAPNIGSLGLMKKITLITDPAYRNNLPENLEGNALERGWHSAYRRYMKINSYIGHDISQKVNFWGEPITKRSGEGFDVMMLTPWYKKEAKYNDINVFTSEVLNGTGFSTPPKISDNGATVKLTDNEYTDYVKLYNSIKLNGRNLKDHMLALVRNSDGLDNPELYTKYDLSSGAFVTKTKAEIRNYMLSEIKKYKDEAKKQLLRDNPDIRARLKERKTVLDNLEN